MVQYMHPAPQGFKRLYPTYLQGVDRLCFFTGTFFGPGFLPLRTVLRRFGFGQVAIGLTPFLPPFSKAAGFIIEGGAGFCVFTDSFRFDLTSSHGPSNTEKSYSTGCWFSLLSRRHESISCVT